MDNFKTQPAQTHATPTESFTFNYEEIKIDYARADRNKWIPVLSWP